MNQPEETTKYRLLDIAGAVFAEQGFEKATIREISTLAGVNLGAVNYHFGSKERLYVEALLHAHKVVFEQFPFPKWDVETPPQQKLRDFIRTMLRRMLRANSLSWQDQLMMREFVAPSDACRELTEKSIKPLHEQLLSILREMAPEQTPNQQLQKFAFSIVGQCMFYKMNVPIIETLIPEQELTQHFSLDQIADHIINFSLAALGQDTSVVESPDYSESIVKENL